MQRCPPYEALITTLRNSDFAWVANEIETEFSLFAETETGSEKLQTERQQMQFAVTLLENALLQPMRMHVDAVGVFEGIKNRRYPGSPSPALADTHRGNAPYLPEPVRRLDALSDKLEEVCAAIRAAHDLPGPDRGGPGGATPPDSEGPRGPKSGDGIGLHDTLAPLIIMAQQLAPKLEPQREHDPMLAESTEEEEEEEVTVPVIAPRLF